VSLASELLAAWAPILRTVELRSGNTGRFEVTLDGDLLFSKAKLGRHPKRGEVAAEFERRLGKPLAWRKA
jgi:predicted Rdx family selenoprotein